MNMCRNIGKSIPVWQKKGIGWAMDKIWTTLGVLIGKQRVTLSELKKAEKIMLQRDTEAKWWKTLNFD